MLDRMKFRDYLPPMPSVFTRIINREIPAKIFHETETVIVIADHRPKDPVHLLILPKTEYTNFQSTPPEVLAELSETAKLVAEKLGVTGHYRIVINNGYGQEVDHIHFHFLSNKGADKLTWLPL
jgi:histidine triad (HIT) family protein